jgi:acyl-CoA synthetase (AMP-forming)/AMP-acid ligase II
LLTFPQLWREKLAAGGDRLLLVADSDRRTYADLDRRSRMLAKALIAAGCGKGSHVALLHPNGADFLAALIAALRIGAVAVPLSTLSTPSELGWLLTSSDSRFLFAARAFRSQDFERILAAAVPGLDPAAPQPLALAAAPWLRRVWFAGDPALEALAAEVDDSLLAAAEDSVRPSDRLLMVHTSGSTSRPKAVLHTHGQLWKHLGHINAIRGFGADEVLFSTSPWFWIAGLAYGLLATIEAGAAIVLSNETDAARVLDLIEREKPTITNGHFSTVVRLAADPSFAARDFSSIRRGNLHPIHPPAIRAADFELRHNIFGMTEVGGALTMDPDESDQGEHRRGSCGRFLPGFAWRIVDPETRADVPPGDVGELWLRGPLMMEGYYGRTRDEVFEPDGWWRSSDLGRVDADGFFYPVSRLSELIKTSGANVAPSEVAGVLRKLTGRDCIVLGLPDKERGQIVAALVIGEAAVDEAALREAAARTLSRYKVPRVIRTMEAADIPMLSSGKIDMRGLQDWFLA